MPRRRARRLAILTRIGILGPDGGWAGPSLIVTLTNNTTHPVTIASIAFLVEGSRRRLRVTEYLHEYPGPLPVRLEPDGSWTGATAPVTQLLETLNSTLGYRESWWLMTTALDAAGKKRYGERFVI